MPMRGLRLPPLTSAENSAAVPQIWGTSVKLTRD